MDIITQKQAELAKKVKLNNALKCKLAAGFTAVGVFLGSLGLTGCEILNQNTTSENSKTSGLVETSETSLTTNTSQSVESETSKAKSLSPKEIKNAKKTLFNKLGKFYASGDVNGCKNTLKELLNTLTAGDNYSIELIDNYFDDDGEYYSSVYNYIYVSPSTIITKETIVTHIDEIFYHTNQAVVYNSKTKEIQNSTPNLSGNIKEIYEGDLNELYIKPFGDFVDSIKSIETIDKPTQYQFKFEDGSLNKFHQYEGRSFSFVKKSNNKETSVSVNYLSDQDFQDHTYYINKFFNEVENSK